MANVYVVSTRFKGIDELTPTLTKMGRQSNKTTLTMESSFSRVGSKMKSGFGSLGGSMLKAGPWLLAAGGVVSFGQALADAAKVGMDFEQTLVNASAKFGLKNASREYKALEKTILDVSSTSKFTATDAAKTAEIFAMAGRTSQQTMAGLPTIANVAAAGNVTLAEAAEDTISIVSGMGLASDNAEEYGKNMAYVSDVLAKGANTHKTSFRELAFGMSKAAPLAATIGMDTAELASLVGGLMDTGVKAEEAGTSIKSIFTNIKTATADKGLGKMAKEMGISFHNAKGQMLPVTNILKQLEALQKKGVKGAKNYQKLTLAMAGKDHYTKLLTILKGGSGKLEADTKNLRNSAGYAKQLADQMNDTTKGGMMTFFSKFERLQVTVFSKMKGDLTGVFDIASDVVDYITKGIDEDATWFVALETAWSIFKGILKTVKGIWEAFTFWTDSQEKLGDDASLFAQVMNSVGLKIKALFQGIAFVVLGIMNLVFRMLDAIPGLDMKPQIANIEALQDKILGNEPKEPEDASGYSHAQVAAMGLAQTRAKESDKVQKLEVLNQSQHVTASGEVDSEGNVIIALHDTSIMKTFDRMD